MKKQILLLALMLLPMVAGAQGVVEIDGIYYELVSKIKEATVTIPISVTSIENSAFYGCRDLTSVSIGSGVKSISNQAFASCKELTDVYCLAEAVPNTDTDVFQESYIEYATLHVPTTSVLAARPATLTRTVWSI